MCVGTNHDDWSILFSKRFMYPQHMLSDHFLTEEQKVRYLAAASEVRLQSFRGLLSSERCQDSCEQWRQMKTFVSSVSRDTISCVYIH